jgi:rubrerythrin
MPPIDVKTLDLKDALDLAILIEDEARERYEQFSRIVGGRYAGDASDMFKMMASNEAKHGRELSERRKQLFASQPARLTRDMLDDIEAPDLGKPRVFMSARQAMEVALDSEVKAAEFFEGALDRVGNEDVRKLFHELHGEEILHQRLVREKLAKLPTGPDLEEADADAPGSDPG